MRATMQHDRSTFGPGLAVLVMVATLAMVRVGQAQQVPPGVAAVGSSQQSPPDAAAVGSSQQSPPDAATVGSTARPWSGIGRPATRSEIEAWDIDVRADFKGLPPGRGSVEQGLAIWEAKCVACHGTFGESNDVFTPIVGGTIRDDLRTGRVSNLKRPDYPQRTTTMRLSQISTLWDYVNRAMPWNEPKSLKPDEVYAVLAYILNLAEVVDDGFVLSDRNMAEVQNRLPNRHGMVTYPGLWSANGKPDVQGDDCMRDCRRTIEIRSTLPDFARNSHGNLAEQHRVVGPVRGADTTQPALREPLSAVAAATPKRVASVTSQVVATAAPSAVAPANLVAASGAPSGPGRGPDALARDSNCLACHATASRVLGPSFREVAERYRGDSKAEATLAGRVKNGAQGAWGGTPMPPHPNLADEDVRSLVRWILAGAS